MSNPNSLYHLTNEYMEIVSIFQHHDELTDEAFSELNTRFEELKIDFKEKAINVAKYIRHLDNSTCELDAEIVRLTKRKRATEAQAERLRKYLQMSIQSAGLERIENPLFDIRLRQCPLSVHIENADILPQEFMAQKITYAPDKSLIREHIERGIEVPGAALKRNIKLEIK